GAPMRDLTKVQRHILFPRKKYFVIYDEFASASDSIYSQLYHVLEDTLTIDTNGMKFNYVSTNQLGKGQSVTTYVAQVTAPSGLNMVHLSGNDVAKNLFLPGYFGSSDNHPRAHAIWTNTKLKAKTGHFLTVIYPVKPGNDVPEIIRKDDYTVEVNNGSEHDIISFDANTSFPATIKVDLKAMGISGDIKLKPTTPRLIKAEDPGND
ncbi:MAG: hypothetical protein ABJC04_11740, partial [Verrucomicrobiota bacterium]